MKNPRSKRLPKSLETICDYNKVRLNSNPEDTRPTGSDPTTATVTIIITTASSHKPAGMLM